MKIALVSEEDGADPRSWSGIPFSIARALRRLDVDVVHVSPLPVVGARYQYARWKLRTSHRGLSYRTDLAPAVLRGFGRFVSEQLAEIRPDAVISTTVPGMSAVYSRAPVATWTDATLPLLIGSYPEFVALPGSMARRGVRAEQATYGRVRVAAFAAPWAAASAQERYSVADERVVIAPFGANLDPVPTPDEAEDAWLRRSDRAELRLLFVGVDWERKRAAFAIDVLQELRRMGLDASLRIVGCQPPPGSHVPEVVQLEGFLDKSSADGAATFTRWLLDADFLLFPTAADCFGIVVSEASAAGVPTVATNVDGVPGAVHEAVNGHLFPKEASAIEVAALIRRAADDGYVALCRSARQDFERRLNWEQSARAVLDRLTA